MPRDVLGFLIASAREWVSECEWVEDEEYLAELTDAQIVRGVNRHFAGGWAAFVLASL